MPIDRITVFCFAASYGVALGLEVIQLFWPRPLLRLVSILFGSAGLLAHTLVLFFHHISLSSQYGSMLFLAWILAVFYLYGSIHHRKLAWGIFVLPIVLVLILLAGPSTPAPEESPGFLASWRGPRFWATLHGGLLLLAFVGVCVGFVASVMYLIQAYRLKAKIPPRQGLQLMNLESLEAMTRRAIIMTFPLLTAGVIVGGVLLFQADPFPGWTDPKILGAMVLWLVFALMLYLRYGLHLRGRRLALFMIAAFALLVFTLAATHTSAGGGQP